MYPKIDVVGNNATYFYFFLLEKSYVQNIYKFNVYEDF